MRKLFLINMTRLLIHKLKKNKFIPISPFDKPPDKKKEKQLTIKYPYGQK
jgi:hypothetical protein